MPRTTADIHATGVGNQTVRLDTIPLEIRLQALDQVIGTAKTELEARRLLRIAIDPGDAGGRIAA